MEDFLFSWVLSGAVMSGLIGIVIGSTRSMRTEGWWYGFLLGPIGWIIVLLVPKSAAPAPRKLTARERMLPPVRPPAWDELEAWEEAQRQNLPHAPLPVPEQLKGRKMEDAP